MCVSLARRNIPMESAAVSSGERRRTCVRRAFHTSHHHDRIPNKIPIHPQVPCNLKWRLFAKG